MTLKEKILITITLLLGLCVKLMEPLEMQGAGIALTLTYLSLVTLIVYYLTQIKLSLFSVVLGLMIIENIGVLFQIQYWPGQEIMYTLGLLGTLLFSGLLIWNAKKDQTEQTKFYFYLLAVILLAQIILSIIQYNSLYLFGQFLSFLTIAIIGTIKLGNYKLNTNIDKILNVMLVQGMLFLISNVYNLVK